MLTAADYLRLALDPDRLAVLGHAAVGPLEVERLAEALDADPQRLLRAAGRLREAGLLTEDLRLDRAVLRQVAESLPSLEPAAEKVTEGPWSEEEAETLQRFFHGSRLTQIPAARNKRVVVLERLAQEFVPGVRYEERDVNSILQVFWDDYASLRRHLVDEGFLTRASGFYWRSGGRYDPIG